MAEKNVRKTDGTGQRRSTILHDSDPMPNVDLIIAHSMLLHATDPATGTSPYMLRNRESGAEIPVEVEKVLPHSETEDLGFYFAATARAVLLEQSTAVLDSVRGLTRAMLTRRDVDVDLFAELLDEVSEALIEGAPKSTTMSQSQRALLIESGALTAEEIDQAEKEIAAGELQRLQLRTQVTPLVESLSTADVAERLNIDESRVRHRVSGDLLYSWKAGRIHRFPKWQFTDDGKTLLPELGKVVKAIPDDLSPASLQRLMTSPQNDLLIDGEPVSPREWLLSGHDVEEVVELIKGIDS